MQCIITEKQSNQIDMTKQKQVLMTQSWAMESSQRQALGSNLQIKVLCQGRH